MKRACVTFKVAHINNLRRIQTIDRPMQITYKADDIIGMHRFTMPEKQEVIGIQKTNFACNMRVHVDYLSFESNTEFLQQYYVHFILFLDNTVNFKIE